MSNEQKQKLKDYRKEYYKKYYAEKKVKKQKIIHPSSNCKKVEVYDKMIFFVFDKHKNNIVVLLTLGKSKKLQFLLTLSKSKNIVILLTLSKSKNIVILLTLGKSLGWPLIFNLNKTPLGETGCLSNPYFLLTDCLGIQFFDSFTFPNTAFPNTGYLWLPTPNCAALVWLTGRYALPLVTKCFPLNPYLGKWRISLGVTSILSICLHPFYFSPKGYM